MGFLALVPVAHLIAYRVIPNWELAGELLSMAFGTVGVVLLYYLMREVYGRRGVAAGAAALAAIHPMLAGLSASVRTEAGYITLVTAAVLFLVRGVERKRIASIPPPRYSAGWPTSIAPKESGSPPSLPSSWSEAR